MKLPILKPPIKQLLRDRRAIITGVIFLLIVVGILFRLLTPAKTPSIPPPSYAPITPKPGINPPTTVNLDQLQPVIPLPASLPAYNLTLADFGNSNQIAESLGFSTQFRTVGQIKLFTNNQFVLTLDSVNHQLAYGYSDDSLTQKRGDFASIDSLLNQLASQIKLLNIFDSRVNFSLSRTNYRVLDQAYLIPPERQNEATITQLVITPQVDWLPVYLQQPVIVADFNRQNTLIKLDISYPFSSISTGEVTQLLPFAQVRQLPPQAFFPIYISPVDIAQAWAGPIGLSSIQPQELSLGYYLDITNNILQPIYTYKSGAGQPDYLYATLAFPTNSVP